MSVQVTSKHFLLNDKPFFLNSGEMHYFRVPRDKWETHLKQIKEAGLNTVSTYISWDWHEEEEGQFDFTGQTKPEKDLAGWLDLCQKYGLYAIVKPGPIILAEYRGAGIPFWFNRKYGAQCRVKNSQGQLAQTDCMTFMDPVYLEHVRKWYDQVLAVIQPRQINQGGPVILMQVCNEVGVFTWLAHQADYSEECLTRYQQFLAERYESIDQLNQVYAESNRDFKSVKPISDRSLTYTGLTELAKDYDWHLFWRRYYGDYLRYLMSEIRKRGITVPFYHNLPGWIYGSGWEFPLNITMYSDLYDQNYPEMIFGVDHIPEYMSYRNAHDDRVINDIVAAMQQGGPLFAAEFQSGSREYHVVPNPREMELFYKASIGHGLVGWNYYMFSQGKNQPLRGFSGQNFYWYTPLTNAGEQTSAYPLVQKTSALIQTMEQEILQSERKAEIAVAFYAPYYATELEKSYADLPLHYQPSKVRRAGYFDGLLKALQMINIDYDMIDLERCSLDKMQSYRQVWVFALDVMGQDAQSKVVEYMEQGGQAVIYPTLPEYDTHLNPCTRLKDAVGVRDCSYWSIDSPLVQVLGRDDIKCHNPLRIFKSEELPNSKALVYAEDKRLAGFQTAVGKGQALVVGTMLGYDIEDHRLVYEDLLKLSSAQLRQANASGDRILVNQRSYAQGGLLFVGNFHNEDHQSQITYTHPATQEKVSFPLLAKELNVPGLYGILTPLLKPLSEGVSLLHTTSHLLKVDVSKTELVITLEGDRDLKGELVLEGPAVAKLSLKSPSTGVVAQTIGSRWVLTYEHGHQTTLTMTIAL